MKALCLMVRKLCAELKLKIYSIIGMVDICRNPKCSNVAKCSNYYILPCNYIDIYRQNVVIYYKTGYHFLTSVALM